jgi:hypothetical protein
VKIAGIEHVASMLNGFTKEEDSVPWRLHPGTKLCDVQEFIVMEFIQRGL